MDNVFNWFIKRKTNLIYLGTSFLIATVANIYTGKKILLSESIFWLTVPVLIFSVINLFFKGSIFVSWAKFTKYFFIVSLFIILLAFTPASTYQPMLYPSDIGNPTLVLVILYSTVSLSLILYKSFKKNKKSVNLL